MGQSMTAAEAAETDEKLTKGLGGKLARRAVPLHGAVNCCGFWTM